jgi:hypothetical protein
MADVVALTDNALEDQDPHISGGMVVWEVFDGNDWEVFLFNDRQVLQLTDNSTDEQFTKISDDDIV